MPRLLSRAVARWSWAQAPEARGRLLELESVQGASGIFTPFGGPPMPNLVNRLPHHAVTIDADLSISVARSTSTAGPLQ